MLIRAGYEISIECQYETPLLALLSVHPLRSGDLRTPAIITSSGNAPIAANIDEFGNLRSRTVAPAGILQLSTDFVIADSGQPDEVALWADEVPVPQLPEEAVSFLLGSRYCETDRLSELAVGPLSLVTCGVPVAEDRNVSACTFSPRGVPRRGSFALLGVTLAGSRLSRRRAKKRGAARSAPQR